ncbi:hypothetical protein ABW20_dc0100150 [Dactylellina cionopaga]|nr:hypothetical protein ABW20_dc0100150 [Dactylellina cionopaga]
MPFVPELVSTTRYSNRSTDASAGSEADSGSGQSNPHVSKPRFLPEPIETTRKSNRTSPSEPSQPSSNSSTPKATLLNNADAFAAVVLPSATTSIAPTITTAAPTIAPTSRFLPEPLETTRRSNRTPAVNAKVETKGKGWGRDSDDEKEERDEKKERAAGLNQAHQRRTQVPIVGPGKSKWFPNDETCRWGTASPGIRSGPQSPSQASSSQPSGTAATGYMSDYSSRYGNSNINDTNGGKPEEAKSSQVQVRDRSANDSGDPRLFNHSANNRDVVAGILAASSNPANANTPRNARSGEVHQDEDQESIFSSSSSSSLSSSPTLSRKSTASGSNYHLVPSITNSHYFSADEQIFSSTATATHAQQQQPSSSLLAQAGIKRPISPGSLATVLVQDFAYDSTRPTPLKLPKAHANECIWQGAAASVPKKEPSSQIVPQHNVAQTNHINIQSPPGNGLTSTSSTITTTTSSILNPSNRSCHRTDNNNNNNDSRQQQPSTAADLLRDQLLAAQSQSIRDKQVLLTPSFTPNTNFTNNRYSSSPLNGSDEPKRKKPLLPFSFIPAAPRAVIYSNNTFNINATNNKNLHIALHSPKILLSPAVIPTTPLLCESPMPTTLFYESSKMSSKDHVHGDYFSAKKEQQSQEKRASNMSMWSNASSAVSRDTALTTPSTRPSSPALSKYGYQSTSSSSLVQMVCQQSDPTCDSSSSQVGTISLISADPPNMCPSKKNEVTTEFVVAVFNYLSLGHESIARKFDRELSEATGWGLERVVTDRLGALREYVEEYVDRTPGFGSGMGGW